MRIAYDWTESEWNEAVKLATEDPRRRGSVPGMVYALVGIPLFGAVMDGVRSVRGTGKLSGAGMAVPLMLILLGVALGAGVLATRRERSRRTRSQTPLPVGQWEAVVQEAGWHFHAKPEDAATAGVLPLGRSQAEAAGEPPVDEKPAPGPNERAVADEETTPVAKLGPVVKSDVAAEVTLAAVSTVIVAPQAVEMNHIPPALAEADTVPVTAPPIETPAATVPAVTSAKRETPLQPWNELTGSRTGERVIVLLHRGGFHAVPTRCMTPEQASHLHRMVIRKLRPSAVQPPR